MIDELMVDIELRRAGMTDEFQRKCKIASMLIEDWMKDKDNSEYIHEKQAEYVHNKGWSKNKLYREEYTIPHEAFFALPREIRDDKKRLREWIKANHRYLVFS